MLLTHMSRRICTENIHALCDEHFQCKKRRFALKGTNTTSLDRARNVVANAVAKLLKGEPRALQMVNQKRKSLDLGPLK